MPARAVEIDAVPAASAASTSAAVAPSADAPAFEPRDTLRRAARGESDAVGELYSTHAQRVGRWLTSLLGPHAPIEDLVQETFVLALRSVHRFGRRSSLSTWLHGIALNVARNQRAKHRRRLGADASRPSPAKVQEFAPEATLDSRRALARLHDLLERLPDAEREVFILRSIEQLPVKEVAQLVGASISTVSARNERARTKLEDALNKGGGRDG